MNERINAAVQVYLDRQARITHPAGKFDKAGRWYPIGDERCECCNYIRTPSRAWPFSLMMHCRTMEHVAHLYDVDIKKLRRAVNATRKLAA
jgi:hypothetical protein